MVNMYIYNIIIYIYLSIYIYVDMVDDAKWWLMANGFP